MNVACAGAEPIGVTDCLNFGSPETELGAWQLERAVDGIADACRALALPVVSGNVSLYNETPAGPILPTPVVGTVGLLEDRAAALRMTWRDGDELWLLGDPADDPDALAGSELAWRAGSEADRPALDLEAAAAWWAPARARRARPGARGPRRSAGGVAVALARMAIAARVGARSDGRGRPIFDRGRLRRARGSRARRRSSRHAWRSCSGRAREAAVAARRLGWRAV